MFPMHTRLGLVVSVCFPNEFHLLCAVAGRAMLDVLNTTHCACITDDNGQVYTTQVHPSNAPRQSILEPPVSSTYVVDIFLEGGLLASGAV